jgi:hypothetical protein
VQAVVAVVGTAQAGFQDLVDRLGLDIDQLAGLDDASNMRGSSG